MTYFTLTPYALALLLSLGWMPQVVHAQQLQQPASILPWHGSRPEMQLALRPPLTQLPNIEDSPAWLVDSGKQPAQTKSKSSGLFMVETEEFVDLGTLNQEPTAPTGGNANRKWSGKPQAKGPGSFLRALGIQAFRPGKRN